MHPWSLSDVLSSNDKRRLQKAETSKRERRKHPRRRTPARCPVPTEKQGPYWRGQSPPSGVDNLLVKLCGKSEHSYNSVET